jgi:hypothetical protein
MVVESEFHEMRDVVEISPPFALEIFRFAQ